MRNKTPLFTIIRLCIKDTTYVPHLIDTYPDASRAQEMRDNYASDFSKRGITEFDFIVQPSYFYNY